MEKNVSVIWLLKEQSDENEITRAALEKQTISKEQVQIILCPKRQSIGQESWMESFCQLYDTVEVEASDSKAVLMNRARKQVQGRFTVAVESGDTFGNDYLSVMSDLMKWTGDTGFCLGMSLKRCLQEEKEDILSKRAESEAVQVLDFHEKYSCLPYFLAGTWIRSTYLKTHSFREDLKYEWEKEYLLRIVIEKGKMLYAKEQTYEYYDVRENNLVYFQGHYDAEWYYESIDRFWVPFLQEVAGEKKEIPRVIQYQVMFALHTRVEANLNNLNKHCVPEEEAESYLWSWNRLLKYIEDAVIMNQRKLSCCTRNIFVKQMFLKIKYMDENYTLKRYYLNTKTYFGADCVLDVSQDSQKANIQFMEYRDGTLSIDGTLSSLFDVEKGRFYVKKDETEYGVSYNERYSHIKLFGFTIYKRISFRVELPIENTERQQIEFRYKLGDDNNKIQMSFDSHMSRLSKSFRNGYWVFGEHFMAIQKNNKIVIYTIRKRSILKREVKLLFEMSHSKNTGVKKYAGLRAAYFVLKPFLKRRPIWMFLDKIYKAGDSSEYLYRYACAQDDGIDKYYLVDKNSPDCARLKADGFKPLIRGSWKHRLIFLYADMMVISNSTVFAFNDYRLANSAYMRDLFQFHVVCVQHGMSVQKIAVAQNRLRDNIRLYFCASKYEIENLSRPIYDYVGHDALKLTGVPRYDGLISKDKRQILIAPTWRMQAAVPVTKNEGVQRGYNPLFRESSYFKVYNSLINDERLIAAAKKYKYRVLYVLHPIVSAQAEDFDKNDYVDVIPSVGDFSYEKAFCESSLMVSDYSGVQFDFAYMRKPVVYLHHNAIPQHYEEGTFHYDTMAFGEICHNNDELIDVLIEYMKNDCKMKEEYRKRADDFFFYDDHNNCQRIYDVMLEYQRKLGETKGEKE